MAKTVLDKVCEAVSSVVAAGRRIDGVGERRIAVRRVRHRCDACRTRRAQVIVAIRAVQDHKGASRQAIVKYLKSEFQCENGVAIKRRL